MKTNFTSNRFTKFNSINTIKLNLWLTKFQTYLKRILRKYDAKGKIKSLTPPGYIPPLQRPVEILSYLSGMASIPIWMIYGWELGSILLLVLLSYLGLEMYLFRNDHTIQRVYGPLGRLRYIFEDVFRDKYLQYFNETNTDGRPMPKIVRDYIYQKAKGIKSLSSLEQN